MCVTSTGSMVQLWLQWAGQVIQPAYTSYAVSGARSLPEAAPGALLGPVPPCAGCTPALDKLRGALNRGLALGNDQHKAQIEEQFARRVTQAPLGQPRIALP